MNLTRFVWVVNFESILYVSVNWLEFLQIETEVYRRRYMELRKFLKKVFNYII